MVVDSFEVLGERFEVWHDKLFSQSSVDDLDVIFYDVVEDLATDFYRCIFVVGVELLVLVDWKSKKKIKNKFFTEISSFIKISVR